MGTMTQQELRPAPGSDVDDDDDLYEEEPRRRPWGAILSVLLALALTFVGYQWHQATGREQQLGSQIGALRAEAETQRLRAEDAQRQAGEIQKRVAALGAERDALAERLAALERSSRDRGVAARERKPTVAKERARPGASPVAARASAPKKTAR